jgi:hypothetical protein
MAVAGLTCPRAWAADTVLATSASHGASVSVGGGAAWCAPSIDLHMQLRPDSPDIASAAAQAVLLRRLGPLIARSCPQAREARAIVTTGTKVLGRFRGDAATGWAFAGIPDRTAQTVDRQTPAVPDIAPSEAPPAALPAERDYASLLLAFLHQTPALQNDPQILSYWAALKHAAAWQRARGQEFRQQPLLETARAELAERLAATTPRTVTLGLPVQFGAYDFTAHQFPFTTAFNQLSVWRPCCGFGDPLPAGFAVKLGDAEALNGLPMAPDMAQRFLEARTNRFGGVDRQLLLVMTVALTPEGFAAEGGTQVATGTLQQVVVMSAGATPAEILRLDSAQLAARRQASAAQAAALQDAAARKAAALQQASRDQQAALQRAMLAAQRDAMLSQLRAAPLSVRLANFTADPSVNTYARLDDLRDARTQAVLSGRPANVVLLIQAGGSGRHDVATTWPGSLQLDLPASLPPVSGGSWYLVRGALAVPPGNDAPPARLAVREIAACAQENCADLADPVAILRRKLGQDAAP